MQNRVPKTCKRCGKCCLADANAYITDEDRKRWKKEGRTDILQMLEREHAIWAGDHLISSENGRYLHGCIFLAYENNQYVCKIYETRPKTCRDYEPGSSEICPQFRK
ncbi:MAG: YkgJ family cysteine cluster protein [Deltaproteobacteria bacterium]|nr:YkgJ family cysteine cluster protein [Deltaproteobacteria bacterium]